MLHVAIFFPAKRWSPNGSVDLALMPCEIGLNYCDVLLKSLTNTAINMVTFPAMNIESKVISFLLLPVHVCENLGKLSLNGYVIQSF